MEVTPGGFDQINPATNRVLCSYDYRNIEGFVDLSDYQGGFCILYGGFSRLVSSVFKKLFKKGHAHLKESRVCILHFEIWSESSPLGGSMVLRVQAVMSKTPELGSQFAAL